MTTLSRWKASHILIHSWRLSYHEGCKYDSKITDNDIFGACQTFINVITLKVMLHCICLQSTFLTQSTFMEGFDPLCTWTFIENPIFYVDNHNSFQYEYLDTFLLPMNKPNQILLLLKFCSRRHDNDTLKVVCYSR